MGRAGEEAGGEQACISAWGHSTGVVTSRKAGHKELSCREVTTRAWDFLSLSLFIIEVTLARGEINSDTAEVRHAKWDSPHPFP